MPNYGFEAGLSDWTPATLHRRSVRPAAARCADAVVASTTTARTGTASVRTTVSKQCPLVALRSSDLPVTAGTAYRGFASVQRDTGSAGLALVFADANGKVVGLHLGRPGQAEAGAWGTVRAAGTAPKTAATMSVVVYGDPRQRGVSYVDDVMVTAQDTNLGTQLSKASLNAVTFADDGAGAPLSFGVVTGSNRFDAHLIGVDSDTGAVRSDHVLPGATGAWAATTSTDGTVYIGTYNYTDPAVGSRLFAYTPSTDALVDLGRPISNDQFVWGLTAGPDGAVYGGGYPSGAGFAYLPGKGFSQIGARPLIGNEQYGHSTAYDPTLDLTYMGIGAHAHLMACPHAGATCTDILPAQYQSEEFVYSLSAGGGYVFANLAPSGDGHLVVLKVSVTGTTVTATVVTDIAGVKYPGASGVIDGKVYFAHPDNTLGTFDLASQTVATLGVKVPVNVRAFGAVHGPAGTELIAMGNRPAGPAIARYDLATRVMRTVPVVNPPATPTELQTIQAGPDHKIYSSGYLLGGTGVYTPMRSDQNVQYSGLGQAEGQAAVAGKQYFGIYPGANIYAYDPTQTWLSGTNPKRVCSLTAEDQDRPYGMTDAAGQLYIGTMPGYGKLGGALTHYDPTTGTCTTMRDIVPAQSIVSLAYLDGTVYGGSMIWGGLGSTPTATDAKLLIYDVATGKSEQVALPDPGLRSVLGLTVGPDHRIWMIAEDHLLIFDPSTKRFVEDKKVFPELNIPASTRIEASDATLVTGPDGAVYGTIHNAYLFKIDPRTHVPTIVRSAAVHGLTTDEYGNLYYIKDNLELWRYAP